MLIHPDFNPVAISIGPLSVHWYGLMYLLAFMMGLYLGKYRAKQTYRGWNSEMMDDFLFYFVAAVIVGGRVGYVFFYHIDLFFENPLYLFRIWDGGMSFHGGFIGVLVAVWLFGRKYNKTFPQVGDFIAPLVPLGLAAGRVGNFINGELWGRETDVSWGMIFPQAGDGIVRHPSQLYQVAGEGISLFLILWFFTMKPRPRWAASGLFVAGYGFFRCIAEFFRKPDEHIGYLAFDFLTMGILLSVPMMLAGGAMMLYAYRSPIYDDFDKVKPKQKKGKKQKKTA